MEVSRDFLSDQKIINRFASSITTKNSFTLAEEGIEFDVVPFPHGKVRNLLQNKQTVNELELELLRLKYNQKNNDLYKFEQSDDLKGLTSSGICQFRDFLYGEFRLWLTKITGISFKSEPDASVSKYLYTDHLLCHDDDIQGTTDGRRYAFVYYLVPDSWSAEDGGCLDLYSVDEKCQPSTVSKSLLPERNSIVFFEVTDRSYHRVNEILSQEKCRLSISGWFRGPAFVRPEPQPDTPMIAKPMVTDTSLEIPEWIDERYMDPETQIEIQENFEECSEIQLSGFIKNEKYLELAKAFRLPTVQWIQQTPANRRKYDVAQRASISPVLEQLVQLFESEFMFLMLSTLSGLSLHPAAAEDGGDDEDGPSSSKRSRPDDGGNPRCVVEIRRWKHGDYTLLDDRQRAESALDIAVFFNSKELTKECGGFSSYVARGEDEELLTIFPEENALTMTYRDDETMRFFKYINNRINRLSNHCFYELSAVYYE